MPGRRLTRREAVQIGAGAAALATLPLPRPAFAHDVPVFEVPLPDGPSGARSAAGWRTLDPLRAPHRFDLMGVRWRHAREARVQVRARPRGGRWTAWTELHAGDGHAPDGGRSLSGTEPAWTGAADFFQVRLRGDLRGARVRLVRAGPAARSNRARAARRGRVASAPGAPPIIPRTEWAGDRCKPRTAPSYGEVQLAFVHHTVSANDYGPEDSAGIVLAICSYHRDTHRWNDIGYNFLVDRYGQVFEGRAGGVDAAVVGAQAQGFNSVSTGVACIGEFSDVAQSEAGLEALAHLLGWKLSVHGAPPQGEVTVTSAGGSANRYPAGEPVTLQRISGHRDGGRTACPGDALYGQLAQLRERATAYAGAVDALSVRVSDSRVRHGSDVEVSGVLRFGDGSPPGGMPIEVLHQPSGEPEWSVLADTRTADDGSWSVRTTPPASGRLRARFPGGSGRPAVEGGPVAVAVVPEVTLDLERRVPAGRPVDVEGTVLPTWPSRIRLTFERRAGGNWLRVQRKRVNVRGGRFSTYVRPPRTGAYRVRVRVPGASASRGFRAVPFTGGAASGS